MLKVDKMAAQTVNDRVSRMMREHMVPVLRPMGFRITRKVFWKDDGQQCQVISLRLSDFSSPSNGQLFVELGVYWHEVERLLATLHHHPERRMPPPEYACTFRCDLGYLYSDVQGLWRVLPNTDYEKLSEELLDKIQRHGLPWLEYRCDSNHVLERCKLTFSNRTSGTEINGWAQTVFMVQNGRIEDARHLLEDWRGIDEDHDRNIDNLARILGLRLSPVSSHHPRLGC
jgi:hypothetical protein